MTALVPLFPTSDLFFEVGTPLNAQSIIYETPDAHCVCERFRYDGSDPRIQFPRDRHVVTGKGGTYGGFHQDCNAFEPWRVRVIDDPVRGGRKMVRCVGGSPRAEGKWSIASWFNQPVLWSEGDAVLVEYTFRPFGGTPARFYTNVEARGELNVPVFKSEAYLGAGFHFTNDEILAMYWRDAVEGSRVHEARMVHRTDHALQFDRWHRLRFTLTPLLSRPNTWQLSARVSVQQKTVWSFQTDESNHPTNLVKLTQLVAADERERDDVGGVCDVRRLFAWRVIA